MKVKILAGILVLVALGAIVWALRPATFGLAQSALTSSDTQNTERSVVNDLRALANSFSTTTTNTFTAAQTFSAGWVISATSTGTNGIALTGGCFSLNGTCLPTSTGSSTLLADANTWSTTGTTTYNGSVAITGNLMVTGNFFAPVQIVASEDILITDGTVANPAIAFSSDPDTGIYRNGSNGVGLSGGGAGATWDGTAFYPNTSSARNLGIVSTNLWNRIYVNYASTTAITATNIGSSGTTTIQVSNGVQIGTASHGIRIYPDTSTTTLEFF